MVTVPSPPQTLTPSAQPHMLWLVDSSSSRAFLFHPHFSSLLPIPVGVGGKGDWGIFDRPVTCTKHNHEKKNNGIWTKSPLGLILLTWQHLISIFLNFYVEVCQFYKKAFLSILLRLCSCSFLRIERFYTFVQLSLIVSTVTSWPKHYWILLLTFLSLCLAGWTLYAHYPAEFLPPVNWETNTFFFWIMETNTFRVTNYLLCTV